MTTATVPQRLVRVRLQRMVGWWRQFERVFFRGEAVCAVRVGRREPTNKKSPLGKVAETSLVDVRRISGYVTLTPPRDRLLFLDAVRLARAARRAPRSCGATLSRGSQIGGRQPDYPCAAASR